jgi:hypothetical protein
MDDSSEGKEGALQEVLKGTPAERLMVERHGTALTVAEADWRR